MAMELVPVDLDTPEKLPELVSWLKVLPFDPEDIKQILVAWHKEMGIPMLKATVDEVLGRSPEGGAYAEGEV